jgi:hypothetical protein
MAPSAIRFMTPKELLWQVAELAVGRMLQRIRSRRPARALSECLEDFWHRKAERVPKEVYLKTGYYVMWYSRRSEAGHLRRWRSASKHGLLICVGCGFSWLKVATAKISLDGEVECRDKSDCFRRQTMRMRVKGENDGS